MKHPILDFIESQLKKSAYLCDIFSMAKNGKSTDKYFQDELHRFEKDLYQCQSDTRQMLVDDTVKELAENWHFIMNPKTEPFIGINSHIERIDTYLEKTSTIEREDVITRLNEERRHLQEMLNTPYDEEVNGVLIAAKTEILFFIHAILRNDCVNNVSHKAYEDILITFDGDKKEIEEWLGIKEPAASEEKPTDKRSQKAEKTKAANRAKEFEPFKAMLEPILEGLVNQGKIGMSRNKYDIQRSPSIKKWANGKWYMPHVNVLLQIVAYQLKKRYNKYPTKSDFDGFPIPCQTKVNEMFVQKPCRDNVNPYYDKESPLGKKRHDIFEEVMGTLKTLKVIFK